MGIYLPWLIQGRSINLSAELPDTARPRPHHFLPGLACERRRELGHIRNQPLIRYSSGERGLLRRETAGARKKREENVQAHEVCGFFRILLFGRRDDDVNAGPVAVTGAKSFIVNCRARVAIPHDFAIVQCHFGREMARAFQPSAT